MALLAVLRTMPLAFAAAQKAAANRQLKVLFSRPMLLLATAAALAAAMPLAGRRSLPI